MKKTANYYVIGGQYQAYYYGATATLIGAKRLANRNPEYWDNWEGWHTPQIYRACDVRPVTNFFGDGYAPKEGAYPIDWETGEPEDWL